MLSRAILNPGKSYILNYKRAPHVISKNVNRICHYMEKAVKIIKYDVNGLIRHDKIPFSENSTTQSKYGKFLTKYNKDNKPDFKPFVGMEIKVLFNGLGHSEILID